MIDAQPSLIDQAVAALHRGDWTQAESLSRESIDQNPNAVSGYQVLSICLTNKRDFEGAHAAIDRALVVNPNVPESHNQKAIIFNREQRFGAAIESLRTAVRLQPSCPYYYMNLAANLKPMGRMVEAVDALENALKFGDDPHILTRLGGAYVNMRRFEKAEECFNRALAVASDLNLTHHEIGYLHFYRGEWSEAWPRFELRLTAFNDLNFYIKQFGLELHWKWGEDLNDLSLLVHTEQGNGDTIQFMRYLPLIKKRFPQCKVTFLVYESLEGVAKNLDLNIDKLVVFYPGDAAVVPTFDRYTSLMSLPHLLGVAEPVSVLPPKERLVGEFPDPDAFNVVICYAGNHSHENDRWRTCPLKYFKGIAEIPGVRLHMLTPHPAPRRWGDDVVNLLDGVDFPVTDLSSSVKNFYDSTGYINTADLIISVDTSLLHLAGSYGVETWGVLPFYGEWRWGVDPDRTVWYPSVRLFRQTEPDDWGEVFERVAAELKAKNSPKKP